MTKAEFDPRAGLTQAQLDAHWMPYTGNRQFKKDPRVIEDPMRKPGPGMLLQAADELDLDLRSSWMVGDTLSDMLAGQNARCKSLLVHTGYGDKVTTDFDAEAPSLAEAADIILT